MFTHKIYGGGTPQYRTERGQAFRFERVASWASERRSEA